MKRVLLFILIFYSYSVADIDYYQRGLDFLAKDDIQNAVNSFEKASRDGNALAMFKLGLISEIQGENQEAINWYKKAKESGNIKAKYRLGVLSCQIKSYDYLDDFKEYAKNSTKDVQYDLAVCLLKKGDNKEALSWFKKVADRNDSKAQYQVAMLVSKKERVEWLKKSAKNGYSEAQFDLGKILFSQRRFKDAKYWLKKAQNGGSLRAKEYLKRIKELDF
jgi:TPR repeat protein